MIDSFYLAAGYSGRQHHARLGRLIEEETSAVCTSGWLDGRHDGETALASAAEDLYDVQRAEALVLVHGPSTRGGKWVELGLALARSKPVVMLVERRRGKIYGPPPPVFAWLSGVARYEVCSDGSRPGDLTMDPTWPGPAEFVIGVATAFELHVRPLREAVL